MIWEKFVDFFHESWHEKMRPFIESEECDKIYAFLKTESKRGKRIAPLSHNVFRCFKETPLNEVKVIIVGMCPYHTFTYEGAPVADGLVMGCSVTGKLQPSLEQFYGGIEKELYNGLCIACEKPADVSYLAQQGVLMFNAALTTEMNKAGSHLELWEPFVKYLFEEVFAYSGIPLIFLGKEAYKTRKYLTGFDWTFPVSHPASASYKNTEWDTEGVFTQVNTIIKQNNGFEIDWLKKGEL
jgi:uracil-DNA glycosylase